MKNFSFFSFLYLSILLLLISNFINSTPTIDISINIEELLENQKCFNNQKSSISDNNQNMVIYELNNNSTSNTIFIQYKSLTKFVISESLNDDSSTLYKDSKTSGSYYLRMNPSKNNYYIFLENNENDSQICFYSFLNDGNTFAPTENNTNIKLSSYELLTSSQLIYYIDNNDFSQNKIFYAIRFEEEYLDKINKPIIQIEINFINSERKKEIIEINDWYLQNNYYYAPFNVPKLKYNEKYKDILLYLDIELKSEEDNDELFTFDLELINSEEITCEFNLNITSNNNNSIINPKIYYINIKKNIFDFDRDILFLKNDINNIYINPFFTSNYNISNDNSALIDKKFIDISTSLFKFEKYSNLPNIDLFLLILDEKCNSITENNNIFISFKFYGGYHSLIHYNENNTPEKFFGGEKNKKIIKMEHCRTQYFINYFKIESNKTDDRILDIESTIGDMHLSHSHEIVGGNLDDYFKQINKLCIKKFENSILSREYNTLIASCPSLDPVMSYIYAHKKNSEKDIISFINQKSLIYIEFNKQYSFEFNDEEKNNEFDFRIKVLRTNIKGSYKIEIKYDSQTLSLENEKNMQILKHTKNSNSNLSIQIASLSTTETENKGFILEIFKSIDILEKEITYIDKEVEKDKLEMDKVILFIYDKNEINSAKSHIILQNDNQANRKISICVHSGKGKYPFIIKPICNDEQENIIIKPKENFTLSYNNPYINSNIDDENNLFYVSILTDRPISYSYKYEREIYLDENKYVDLNHKGVKIFKLSKKINQKKSMYYQINLCGNNYQNSSIFYTFNNSEPIEIKNDIYQEFSLDTIKSFMIEFNSENGNKNGKFKYFYGPANLIKTINNFSKEIYISKNNEDNKLLINFETPFTELIDIQIILIADSPDKYDDFCSLMKFCENYNKDMYNNTKIIKEKIRMRDNTDNFIEISIDKKDIMDFMNKNVDIYVLTKSVGSNLEIYYNVKSQVIDWYQLKKEDDEIIKYNKNLICINCGLYGELKVNNEQNNDDNNNNQNITSNIIQNNNTNNNTQNNNDYNNTQTNNDYNNTQNNSVNEQNLSNSDISDNNSPYNNNQRNNIIKFNFGPFYQNNNNNTEDNNDNKNTNNDNYTNNNDTKRNDNEYRNNRRNNKNKDNNENRINFRNDNNNDNNNNNFKNGNVNNTVNVTNNDKENNLKGKHGNEVKEEVKPKKKKSKKLLYFILFILIVGLIYYCRNKYYNEGVSYSKISKYSYYDF